VASHKTARTGQAEHYRHKNGKEITAGIGHSEKRVARTGQPEKYQNRTIKTVH
jgi:hypothetical protein